MNAQTEVGGMASGG
jgi:hypothetical protein